MLLPPWIKWEARFCLIAAIICGAIDYHTHKQDQTWEKAVDGTGETQP